MGLHFHQDRHRVSSYRCSAQIDHGHYTEVCPGTSFTPTCCCLAGHPSRSPGIIYHLYPATASTALARTHFWIRQTLDCLYSWGDWECC